jgi:hypothetical protein
VTARRFLDDEVAALDAAKIVGVRAGSEHRYTGVWVVVLDRRVFVRSWSDKPTGWYRAFLAEPDGSVQVGEREIPVRAVRTRSEKARAAVTEAYARKYDTKGSKQWVDGFREAERERNTLELAPR